MLAIIEKVARFFYPEIIQTDAIMQTHNSIRLDLDSRVDGLIHESNNGKGRFRLALVKTDPECEFCMKSKEIE